MNVFASESKIGWNPKSAATYKKIRWVWGKRRGSKTFGHMILCQTFFGKGVRERV